MLFSVTQMYSQTSSYPLLWITSSPTSDSTLNLEVKGILSDSITVLNPNDILKATDINNHFSFQFSPQTPLRIISNKLGSNLFKDTSYTIITAYHTKDLDSELGLWSIVSDSNTLLSLSSRTLQIGEMQIKFTDSNFMDPVVNTVSQNIRNLVSPRITCDTLLIGQFQGQYFSGSYAELLIFEGLLSTLEKRKWQTALSLKYSSTMQASNYYSLRGDTLWSYQDDSIHSTYIGGIGKDTLRGLEQSQSKIYGDCLTITLHPEHSPLEGDYILWGHDNQSYDFDGVLYIDSLKYFTLSRTWKLRNHYTRTTGPILSTITLDAPIEAGEMLLLQSNTLDYDINHIQVHTPDTTTPTQLIFRDIDLQTSTDTPIYFFLAHRLGQAQEEKTITDTTSSQSTDQITLTPNPSTGKYQLEVQLASASPITVYVTNLSGKIIQKHHSSISRQHKIVDHISEVGNYIITIEYSGNKISKKLIIAH